MTAAAVYRWREGSPGFITRGDPVAVQIELSRLSEITPDAVVEKARDPKTALHRCFEWDDSEAAERYRLWQARMVVRCVEVVRVEFPRPRPKYVSVVDAQGNRAYQAVEVVVSDADLHGRAVDEALARLEALRVEYVDLVELAEVWSVLREVRRRRRGA